MSSREAMLTSKTDKALRALKIAKASSASEPLLQHLLFGRVFRAGMEHTAQITHRASFRMSIGYRGPLPLESNQEIQTKEGLERAVHHFIVDAALLFMSIGEVYKQGALEDTVKDRYEDFVKDYQDWYKVTSSHWREVIRQSQNIPSTSDIDLLSKSLLSYYKLNLTPDFELLQLETERYHKRSRNLLNIINNYLIDKESKDPIKSILNDIKLSESKLRNPDDFIARMFLNLLFAIKKENV